MNWNVFKQKLLSEQIYITCFSLLYLTFPFGASSFSYDIGPLVIYPYLILLISTLSISFFHKKNKISKFEKYILVFFVLFILHSLVYLFFLKDKSQAKIDIRSVILFSITAYTFIVSFKIIEKEKLYERINKITIFFIVLFSVIGYLEYFTGIHIAGKFTDKLKILEIVGPVFYSPVYFFDNPNNFCLYIILFSLIYLLLNINKNNKISQLFVIVQILIFSILSYSRFGTIIFFVLIIYWISINLKTLYDRKNFYYLLILIILAIFPFVKYDIYMGKIFAPTNERFKKALNFKVFLRTNNDKVEIQKDTIEIKVDTIEIKIDTIVKNEDSIPEKVAITESPQILDEKKEEAIEIANNIEQKKEELIVTQDSTSENQRKQLFFNGIEIYKNNCVFGAGPGQFRQLHAEKKVKWKTISPLGPHNWIIELLSQFGILFYYYISIFAFMTFYALKFIRKNIIKNSFFILTMFVFFIASNMPSGFLILDINWVFTSLLFIFFINEIYQGEVIITKK